MKIAISAGHYPEKPGAAILDGTVSEYGETAAIVGQCVKHFTRAGHKCYLIGTGLLGDKVGEINDLNVDAAVEIHLNAANKKVQGCETLFYPGSSSGRALAESVQRYLADAVGNQNRGAKEGFYRMDPSRGPDYFLEATNCTSIIVEPYFIDAEHGLRADNWTSEKIALAILNGVEEWKEGVS